MKFTNKTYDVLKWVTLVVLPAIASMYLGLADVWNLPYAPQVVGTIMAVDTFMGVLLGIVVAKYMKYDMKYDAVKARLMSVAVFDWQLSNQAYDALKWIAQIFLPALATLYFTLAGVLNLPYADKVVTTITQLDLFLGILLQFNTVQYDKEEALIDD